MNDTNRATNRILLGLIGLVLIVVGGGAATARVWPAAGEAWTSALTTAGTALSDAQDATRIGDATASWLGIGAVAALALVVIVLIVILIRTPSVHRSRALLRAHGAENPLGRVTVKESFASDALTHALAQRDEILSTSVTAHTVAGRPVLHVSVTPRQNTSPRAVVERVDRLVTNLTTVTGQEVPTYISIHSGLRARLAQDQRRLS
ncbi:hypothetical protein N3K63_14150 [Microbacterium sp. W1N]|uniref:hypothetical protein n=1 Tax=Microbacterium festucae TaxID=2977531 RepID=UPI0021C0AAD4|nr:hypothetical protein [Microbacterium festucae]MCT9821423.1 hypothetical protein [Microbacterium festucae]